MNDQLHDDVDALAHEIWAAAQTPPGEPIKDAVARIKGLLRPPSSSQPAATACGGTDDDRPAANEKPICYASVNKHGDVTRTTNRADKWSKVPLYTRSVQQPAVSEEPVLRIRKNASGQIYLTDANGEPFDVYKYVGTAFYAAPVAAQPQPAVNQQLTVEPSAQDREDARRYRFWRDETRTEDGDHSATVIPD